MTPTHLFSREGESALAATMARRPLLAFDFDGTLAPIVARPQDAHVPPALARRLDRLARVLPVAIISGRSVDDLRGRLSFEPHYVIGNHGAEDPAAVGESDPGKLDAARSHLRLHSTELADAGVSIEDKRHSLALHYRLARDRERAQTAIARVVAELGEDVGAFGGKMVMNLVAADAHDKADAVARLVERCVVQAAVFVGDDVNDEAVFERAEPSWLTVKIGRDDPRSAARFCIDAIEVARMLDDMLRAVAPEGADAAPRSR
ncbi:MAG: trehalose-phosphatase, partial [Caldimonas sp.]